MTDLDTLLSQAAHPSTSPAPDSVVDADLARGRRALNHRRRRRTGTRSVVAGALAIGAFAAFSPGSHSSGSSVTGPSIGATTAGTATKAAVTGGAVAGIQLVAYTGDQPKGYTVDSVPSGWEIQGVSNLALVVAPVGDADQDIDDFAGKLVVMLESEDQKTAPTGTPVTVGSFTGVINHDEDNVGPALFFTDGAGHRLAIQVPAALHWSDAQVAAFGTCVHVNATAQEGKG
jgi:hypothetical protein